MSGRPRIADAQVLADVRRVAASHPPLTWQALESHGRYALRTYERRANTLAALRRAAGLPDPVRSLPAPLQRLARWAPARVVAVWRSTRWPDGVRCPRCRDGAAVSRLGAQSVGRDGELDAYRCRDCAYSFSDLTDTFLHGTTRPLHQVGLVLVAQRLGVPGEWLRPLGVDRHGAAQAVRRHARQSQFAEAFTAALLAQLTPGGTHAENHAAL